MSRGSDGSAQGVEPSGVAPRVEIGLVFEAATIAGVSLFVPDASSLAAQSERVDEARTIIDGQVAAIRNNWQTVCDEAGLSPVDRAFLWRRQFLNAYAFEGYAGGLPEGL